MSVPSFPFLAFAVLFALLINASQRPIWREPMMLLANLCFLFSFSRSPVLFIPFAAFVGGSYILIEIVRRYRRAAFWPAILLTLMAFFWLKKYTFVPAGLLIPTAYVAIGLSYIFFRILHLVIDTGQGQLKKPIGILDYLNYTLCFPCIVAGPIQMYPDYIDGKTGRPSLDEVGMSLERITIGMFKVFIVSAMLNNFHGRAVVALLGGNGSELNVIGATAVYAIYLYFNFSGYTDVVIGVGRLMGLGLPENFNHPFVSASFIEFWSRWHITLSTWLRTYVYSPFMMTALRRFPGANVDAIVSVFAFFLTFFLVGAWHGQTSEFLFFGVLQGGGVAINKIYQLTAVRLIGRKEYRRLGEHLIYRALCRGLTFTWFSFTLLWFWGNWLNLDRMWREVGPATALQVTVATWLAASILLEGLLRAQKMFDAPTVLHRFRMSPYIRAAGVATMVFGLLLTVYILDAPPPAIVYKAF